MDTSCGFQHFNPRTREGCDYAALPPEAQACVISIHAPVKGATPFKSSIVYALPLISIHAPVKGATICSTSSSKRSSDFNPRTREGCDSGTDPVYWGTTLISIHAPVKGATQHCQCLPIGQGYFNPRTREGCDLLRFGRQMERPEHFNPRTREGCDTM